MVAIEHQRPALVVFGPGRGRVGEGLPAGVLQPDQRLPAGRGEGDRDVAGPLGGSAGMPGERDRLRRFPAGDGTPDGGLPVRGMLDEPALVEGHRGALAVHALLVQRPPLTDGAGKYVEREGRVRVDEDLPADRRDAAHGWLLGSGADDSRAAGDLGGVGGQGGIPRPDQPLLRGRHSVRGQCVQVPGAGAAVLDQPGVAQHPQVLADRGPAHRQPFGQPSHRRGTLAQQFQDAAAHWLAQRVERGIRRLVTHKQPLL